MHQIVKKPLITPNMNEDNNKLHKSPKGLQQDQKDIGYQIYSDESDDTTKGILGKKSN